MRPGDLDDKPDLAQVILEGADAVFHATVISALGWISQVISLFMRKAPDLTPEVARIMNSECLYSGALAQAELGLKPMPVEEMLRDCHEWLKREGLI